MTYKFSFSNSDRIIINKLNVLINKETFYDDVRKLTKNVKNTQRLLLVAKMLKVIFIIKMGNSIKNILTQMGMKYL